MTKSHCRTVLIGAGNMGKNHARIYAEISQFSAIADVIPEIGAPLAKKYNVPFYTDYKQMLDEIQPDAVSVVVPTKFHKMVTVECLARKIPTLVEKPIASTLTEAEEMIQTAKDKKTILMVGHVERFNPAVQKLQQIIQEGRFGKIINVLSLRVGIAPPNIPNSDVALDLAIHDIDVFNYLLNKKPISAKVVRQKIFRQNVADNASLLLEYKGTSAIIQTNWITPIKMRRLFVTGTELFAELDFIQQKIIIHPKITKTIIDGDFYEFLSLSSEPKKKEVYVSKKEPLTEELRHFLKLIRTKRKFYAHHAYDALAVLSQE